MMQSYSFYVLGDAYDITTVTKQGWYGTYLDTELKFNGQNKPESYAYLISLSGKGYGKEDAVISAIQSKLSGYKKNDDKSTDESFWYINDTTEIGLYERNGNIIVFLRNKTLDEEQDYVEEEAYYVEEDYN
jgi:hypothetical protein